MSAQKYPNFTYANCPKNIFPDFFFWGARVPALPSRTPMPGARELYTYPTHPLGGGERQN